LKFKIVGILGGLWIMVNNLMQADAFQTRSLYSQDAQKLQVELKVWAGYGLTINFIPSGEIIKQVWIADPKQFGFSSNGTLCARLGLDSQSQGCSSQQEPVTVLFIRQIKKIDIPNIPSSYDGSTILTILTETTSSQQQKEYQFKLELGKGDPEYTNLVIKPDSEKPIPILLEKTFDYKYRIYEKN